MNIRIASWSSAITPKPTGSTRFVFGVEQRHGGHRRAGETEFLGPPLVWNRLGPAFERPAGQRHREHVEAVARVAKARSSGPNTLQPPQSVWPR